MTARMIIVTIAIVSGFAVDAANAEPVYDSRLLKKTSLKAGEVGFLDVLKELSTRHKTPIEVDPVYLELCKDSTINILQPVDGITLQSALHLVVKAEGNVGSFVVDRGKVTVRLWEDLDEQMLDVTHSLNSLGPLAQNSEQVAWAIQQSTNGRWQDRDESGGQILDINARSVRIRQPALVHYEIAELLQNVGSAVQGQQPRGTVIDKANDRIVRSCRRIIALPEGMLPLSEVLQTLLGKYKIPYWVDVVDLAEAGISPQEMVTLENRKQSIGQHVDSVLKELELVALVKHETVLITTSEAAEEYHVAVVYNVSRYLSATVTTLDVLDRLMQTDETGPWEEADGAGAEGTPLGALLIIHASRRAHNRIAQALGSS